MAQKEHSLSKTSLFILCIIVISCTQTKVESAKNVLEKVDVSQIPNNTISEKDTDLKLRNGIYYFGNKPFSGYIKSNQTFDKTNSIASYLEGKQHGATKTFFSNGKLATERNYKNGIGYGRHFGYWKNGNMKYDFIYFNDKREGIQKQWYESGNPYCELNFKDDKENGMQKAWRENGKPYINYEVKDGVRYGLQKSALCYTLKNENLK